MIYLVLFPVCPKAFLYLVILLISAFLRAHLSSFFRRVRDRSSAPWMTEEIREARRRRRPAERQWRATRLTAHREIYAKEQAAVKACVQTAKRRFCCEKIDSSPSCRQLFAVSSELLGKSSTALLPSDIPCSDLPDRFCDFFSDKIDRIRDDLDPRSCEPPTFAIFDGPQLSQFKPVTEELICNSCHRRKVACLILSLLSSPNSALMTLFR